MYEQTLLDNFVYFFIEDAVTKNQFSHRSVFSLVTVKCFWTWVHTPVKIPGVCDARILHHDHQEIKTLKCHQFNRYFIKSVEVNGKNKCVL